MANKEADLGNYLNTHPRDRHVFEILKIIDSKSNKQEKINVIREHLAIHKPFQNILMWNYLPRVKSLLPEGNPPFNRNEEDGDQATLWQFVDLFPYFVLSGKSQNMNATKQERLFIDMLETIPAAEADVMLAVKDGKLNSICSLTNYTIFESSALFSNDEGFTEIIEAEKEANRKKRASAKKKPKRKAAKRKTTSKRKKPAAKKPPVLEAPQEPVENTATDLQDVTIQAAPTSNQPEHIAVPEYVAPESTNFVQSSENNSDLDLTK